MPHDCIPEAPPPPVPDPRKRQPLTWLISGYRAGERSQLLALAEALNWPLEIKDIQHLKYALRTNLFRGSDLSGVNLRQSSALTPPWPDIVLAAGLRNEPVCRWVKQQSGGHTLIVHIGKPWAALRHFDLVVTTAQYRLPAAGNVLQNSLTLNSIRRERLQEHARQLAPQLNHLPRPYIALVVGGDSGPYTFGRKAAKRLAAAASGLAQAAGGSLLVTTSARTRPEIAQLLEQNIDAPAFFYHWQADDANNPYWGFLGLADEIIVTKDSISMLSEACATGKPVHMFDFASQSWPGQAHDFRLGAILYAWLMRLGPNKLSRDLGILHRQLLEQGLVSWLGDTLPAQRPAVPDDLERTVARLRQLWQQRLSVIDSAAGRPV